MLRMVSRRGYSLDHLAAMVSDEQGFTTEDLYSHLVGSETSR